TRPRPGPEGTPAPAGLIRFLAFTVRAVQTTKEAPPHEQGEALYHPWLPKDGPRGRATVVLSDRFSRHADRSRLRGSTTLRRFSDNLLYRLGTGIVFRG